MAGVRHPPGEGAPGGLPRDLPRHVELVLAQKNNLAYDEAVKLLGRIHTVMRRLGRSEEFGDYLATVRAAHKPKRNFTQRLDSTTW